MKLFAFLLSVIMAIDSTLLMLMMNQNSNPSQSNQMNMMMPLLLLDDKDSKSDKNKNLLIMMMMQGENMADSQISEKLVLWNKDPWTKPFSIDL